MRTRTAAAAALAVLLSGSGPRPAAQTEPVVITLERTECFGACPAYRVRITVDGRVDYEGRRFVRVVGKASAQIAPETVQELVHEFERIGYFDLKDKYTALITDLPTTTTSIRIGGRSKQVVDYFGAPDSLTALERRIDEVAGSIRWVSVDADAVRALRRGGWTAAGDDGAKYLRDAVQRGDTDTVAALLEAGADPNAGTPSPLSMARSARMIRRLVDAGALVDLADASGRTPLLQAARWLDPEVVAALLDARANPRVAGPGGETPLMAAARSGRAETVRLLLAAGAPAGAVNEEGQTALDAALRAKAEPTPRIIGGTPPPRQFDEIIALLRAAAR
jgi:uncharacterized protein DUF6438/ankyrin repeat protein